MIETIDRALEDLAEIADGVDWSFQATWSKAWLLERLKKIRSLALHVTVELEVLRLVLDITPLTEETHARAHSETKSESGHRPA